MYQNWDKQKTDNRNVSNFINLMSSNLEHFFYLILTDLPGILNSMVIALNILKICIEGFYYF